LRGLGRGGSRRDAGAELRQATLMSGLLASRWSDWLDASVRSGDTSGSGRMVL
jgi:hypothetical protein